MLDKVAHTLVHDAQPGRLDPTHCTDLRGRCISTFRRSIAKWKADADKALLTELPMTPSEQVERFNSFMKFSSARSFDSHDVVTRMLHVAYTRGYRKALSEKEHRDGSQSVFPSLSALSQPSVAVPALYAQLMKSEMNTVLEASLNAMTKELASGVLTQKSPRRLRKLTGYAMQRFTLNRLKTGVNTVITMAYNHGKLKGYEQRGISRVGVVAERIPVRKALDAKSRKHLHDQFTLETAGDDRVCDQCDGLEGEDFSLIEAYGLIPVHPNCRCTVVMLGEV